MSRPGTSEKAPGQCAGRGLQAPERRCCMSRRNALTSLGPKGHRPPGCRRLGSQRLWVFPRTRPTLRRSTRVRARDHTAWAPQGVPTVLGGVTWSEQPAAAPGRPWGDPCVEAPACERRSESESASGGRAAAGRDARPLPRWPVTASSKEGHGDEGDTIHLGSGDRGARRLGPPPTARGAGAGTL